MPPSLTNRTGWTVTRKALEGGMGREVFRAPDGTEYERCQPNVADITIADWKTPGLPVLTLRKRGWQVKNLKKGDAEI